MQSKSGKVCSYCSLISQKTKPEKKTNPENVLSYMSEMFMIASDAKGVRLSQRSNGSKLWSTHTTIRGAHPPTSTVTVTYKDYYMFRIGNPYLNLGQKSIIQPGGKIEIV